MPLSPVCPQKKRRSAAIPSHTCVCLPKSTPTQAGHPKWQRPCVTAYIYKLEGESIYDIDEDVGALWEYLFVC